MFLRDGLLETLETFRDDNNHVLGLVGFGVFETFDVITASSGHARLMASAATPP